ncbi:MAG: hypothetical protein ABI288_11460 [Ginsengibacter sp.]
MKNKIYGLLLFTFLFIALKSYAQIGESFSSFERAKKHSLVFDGPAPDFFQGALLGNGGMGVVVTTRPDAIVLRFGHNNVWDIRLAESHRKEIGTFNFVFNKVSKIPDTLALLTEDPWYAKYSLMAADNYRQPYPRPFPCGSVVLGFDRRDAEMMGYKLDISKGLCEVKLLTTDKKEVILQIFTDMQNDRLWMQLVDLKGNKQANIFNRITVMPDPSTPPEFPKFTTEEDLNKGLLSFRQVMPCQEPDQYDTIKGHPKDKAFRLAVMTNSTLDKKSRMNWDGNEEKMGSLECGFLPGNGFVACVSIQQGLNTLVSSQFLPTIKPSSQNFTASLGKNIITWKDYWNKSGVVLSDTFLEQTWYRNLYFFNCAAKDGATCPGLFANWSYDKIGTAWHGDYHMNYNTQQPFWMTFSSNHLEKNLPYVNLIESLMDVSRKWAKEYYELPGAYFPHSAYPVDMTMNPYPVPTWGWEICETPWAVQGLWWHYLYSGDKAFLKNRAFIPMKEAVTFLVAYMKRPDARGGKRWKDHKYHIFPTVPPELYGLRPGFKYNYDCSVDLTLTKFVFNAFCKAVAILGMENNEEDLVSDIKDILAHFPDYPTTSSEKYGKILVSVPGEHDQVVYNLPNALTTVFPGEDYGLHSDDETFKLLKNTFHNQQNEGGNDLVFLNLQAARIGMLNIEKFKRQVKYSLLPNGTATDMVMQTGGRYSDMTHFNFMANMGIWFENFALPVVINECLMQSYDGIIRLFPNWPINKDAEFHNLRAVGAFLISATLKEGRVKEIKIFSETGTPLKMILPWKSGAIMKNQKGTTRLISEVVEMNTSKGEVLLFTP